MPRTTIEVLPPIILVLTRRDAGEVPEDALEALIEEARERKLQFSVIQIASFADDGAVRPGFNVDVLMEACLSQTMIASACWPLAVSHRVDPF